MKKKVILTMMVAFAMLMSTSAIAQCSGSKTITSYNGAQQEAKNIIDIAVGNEDFSTLVAAVTAAGLVDAIKDAESITLFAPNNAAFSKIPSETLNSLLDPANIKTLQAILTYHVVPGKIDAAALVKAIESNKGELTVETLGGETLTAYINDGNVLLKDGKGNTSTITQTDIDASNGIIHVIDSVVLP